MIEILQREAIYLWYYFTIIIEQIFPYWLLGTVIGSFISVFGKNKIHSLCTLLQSKKLGIFSLIPPSLLGIVSPLCMYGTIPIAASFSQKGIKDPWLATFMMSSILLNPQLILYSAALGSKVLAIRIISCFLCGIVAGVLVNCFFKDKAFFNFTGFSENQTKDVDKNTLLRLLKNIGRNIKATGPYFLIGITLAALFQQYIPPALIENFFGNNKAFGVLMAATIGVPLYMCGGGTIPLLIQWLANGMSLGSASAFMLTGPATKITNLGALKIILGMKNFSLYLMYIIAFSFVTGIIIDILI